MPAPIRRTLPTLSPLQKHLQEWKDCEACDLHKTRKQVVFARGVVPCDVLFIGEAPGQSENVVGRPFVGPAGHLLDHIIKRSMPDLCSICRSPQFVTPSGETCKNGHGLAPSVEARVAITNLIACIPMDPDDGNKVKDPPVESIMACSPRLEQFIGIANPRMIVRVGSCTHKWIEHKTMGSKGSILVPDHIIMVNIIHPAAILRKNIAQKEVLIQDCIVNIQDEMTQL